MLKDGVDASTAANVTQANVYMEAQSTGGGLIVNPKKMDFVTFSNFMSGTIDGKVITSENYAEVQK